MEQGSVIEVHQFGDEKSEAGSVEKARKSGSYAQTACTFLRTFFDRRPRVLSVRLSRNRCEDAEIAAYSARDQLAENWLTIRTISVRE
jgi:hypothetical protein